MEPPNTERDDEESDVSLSLSVSDNDLNHARRISFSRSGDIILSVFFVGVSALLLYGALADVHRWSRTLSWASANAVVTAKKLTHEDKYSNTDPPVALVVYRCAINYTYAVRGVVYSGYRVALLREFGDKPFCDSIHLHPNATRSTCHYDPEFPARSVYTLFFSPLESTLCLVGSWVFAVYGTTGLGFFRDPPVWVFAAVAAAGYATVLFWVSIRLLVSQGPFIEAYVSLGVAMIFALFALLSPCCYCRWRYTHFYEAAEASETPRPPPL